MTGAGLRRFVAGDAAPAGQPPPGGPATLGPQATAAQVPGRTAAAEEACEFCAASIAAHHDHVADLDGPSLMCACRACYLLFTRSGAGRYRAVADRYRSDAARPLSAADWDALEIPVGLAFLLRSSRSQDTRAFYPSPAGVTESQLNLQAWARLAAQHPLLDAAQPDVEAILISRGSGDPGGQPTVEAFLVPVDACYELAGRMRLLWQGFDGGAEARQNMADFLARIRERSRDLSQEP
jgi:Family of unknown function (DUF5947)